MTRGAQQCDRMNEAGVEGLTHAKEVRFASRVAQPNGKTT